MENRIKAITKKYQAELLALDGTREELVKEAIESNDGVAAYALMEDRYGNVREDIFEEVRIEFGLEDE